MKFPKIVSRTIIIFTPERMYKAFLIEAIFPNVSDIVSSISSIDFSFLELNSSLASPITFDIAVFDLDMCSFTSLKDVF